MTNKSMNFRWLSYPVKEVTVDEMNELLDYAKKKYHLRKSGFGCAKVKVVGTYCFIDDAKRLELRICPKYNVFERYLVKKTFEADELKETSAITGMQAYNHVQELFQETKHTDKTLYRTFSGTKYKTEYHEVKRCVPKQIAYIAEVGTNRIMDKAFKADVSSAFPYQMTKTLPTFHDCKKIEGKVQPSEEYPFAFYIKSGHISIWNEFSTKGMKNRFYSYYKEVYDDSVKDADEITILCKASKYTLKEEFEYMYSLRNTDVNQKMYMNACIGYFHRNADPRLSHIAAVVIARNNNIMMQRINKLTSEGNTILYVATDSIVWRGKASDIATEDKYIGSFTYEGKNGKFFGRMVGAYQYLTDSGELTTKCSYLKNDDNKYSIEFGKLPEAKKDTKLIVSKTMNGTKIINLLGE